MSEFPTAPMPTPASESQDIALLFARDPLQHSEQDIDRIIATMRASRSTFNLAARAPAKAKAAPKSTGLDLGISLGDL